MQINKISQNNTNFNGWAQYAKDRIQVCLSTQNYKSGFGVQRLIESIERNSPYHSVSLDISYGFPIFRATPIAHKTMATNFEIKPEIFRTSMASCLRRLNRKLIKDSLRVDKVLDRQDEIAKARTMFTPQTTAGHGYTSATPSLESATTMMKNFFQRLKQASRNFTKTMMDSKEPPEIKPETLVNIPGIVKEHPVPMRTHGLQAGSKSSEIPDTTVIMEGPPPIVNPFKKQVTPIKK